MSIRGTRAGVTQASYNEDAMGCFSFEVLVLSIAVGIGKSSWWWGGGTFFITLLVMATPGLNHLFSVGISAVWGIVGFSIGTAFRQQGADWVLAILAFVISLGIHMGAIQWAEDINAKD